MNDPGLEDVVRHAEVKLQDGEHHYISENQEGVHDLSGAQREEGEREEEEGEEGEGEKHSKHPHNHHHHHQKRGSQHHQHPHQRQRIYDEDDAEAAGLYQPTFWWFASTAFPLFAGTFGPIASLFSVCALSQPWRFEPDEGGRLVHDPTWLIVMNAVSLFCAVVANVFLLFNFARRIPYAIAQPVTITFWYISCILLVIPICIIHSSKLSQPPPTSSSSSSPNSSSTELSSAYYHALISCVLYFSISTLLLFSTLGALSFRAYPPSFSTLTGPQRTLMLQTLSFTLYLALGAGVFSALEGWRFADGVYWADYTLLTIGLGTDFPLTRTGARMLLIPYAALGITLVGLVVSSVRGLLLERAKVKVYRRHLGKEREKWRENILERRKHISSSQEGEEGEGEGDTSSPPPSPSTPNSSPKPHTHTSLFSPLAKWHSAQRQKLLTRLPRRFEKQARTPFKRADHMGPWHRAEFELMRFIEKHVETTERYSALAVSLSVVLLLWFAGSVIFWSCEREAQGWTYPQSIYFTYTTLLTIGYGDFYPSSPAGKPFFIVWSLIAVPAMTVLISNMGDTVVRWVESVTVWCGRWTVLPERKEKAGGKEGGGGGKKKRRGKGRDGRGRKGAKHSKVKRVAGLALVGKKAHPNDKPDSSSPRSPSSPSPSSSPFQHDIEKLGSNLAHFEADEEGRPRSLAARLAREIARLARDLRVKPPKRYTWEEWVYFLDMLGEREEGEGRGGGGKGGKGGCKGGGGGGKGRSGEGGEGEEGIEKEKGEKQGEQEGEREMEALGKGPPVLAGAAPAPGHALTVDIPHPNPDPNTNPNAERAPAKGGRSAGSEQKQQQREGDRGMVHSGSTSSGENANTTRAASGETEKDEEKDGDRDKNKDNDKDNDKAKDETEADAEEKDWQWTWLGDHGPLLSKLTETEWILEKLCFRLEEVLEQEIRDARAGSAGGGGGEGDGEKGREGHKHA